MPAAWCTNARHDLMAAPEGRTAMALLQVVLFLMMCAVALGWVARHFKFPYPIALVIGGGALGFVPRLPQLQFDPQFLLVLVLPPILYQAALLTSWHEFKANIRPIGLLAIGLVIATTLAVGATLKLLIPDIPWSAASVLGGESLVNDASGLVIYKFAVAAVLTGAFSLWEASIQFVAVAAGGVAIGFLMGHLLVFLLNTLIFILIGVQLSAIVARLTDYSLGELFFYGTFVSAVAIFVRFAWVYPATYLPLVARAMLGEQVAPPREGEVFIIGWCGMRGIVSLAAALALPQTLEDGSAFPERDLIIFLTFVVIAVTLVLQGLTLKPLIRMLKVGRDWSLQEEQQRAQMALGKAAIAAIDAAAAKDDIPNELAERIRAEFAEKITLSVPEGLVLRHSGADDARRLRDAAVKAERQELIRLWRENQISDEVLHHIEEDLDYQESRI